MKEVFEKAILTYGQTAQEDVAIEEMSELNGFGLIFRIKFSRDCRVGDDLKICHASHPPCILCGRYGKIQTRATAFVWVCLWVSS